jgi:methionine-rich copper-binding protein CopC
MSKIVWDKTGERLYETGVQKGVLYPLQNDATYSKGVAWNGLTGVTESPSGAESNPQYADDIKYLNLMSTEEFGATIEAFTYPDEFAACDGSLELQTGVMVGQQRRKTFGLCYRTAIGNDVDGSDYGYKIHVIYGAMASPSEKDYATVNDSPEAITFSWDVTTTPVSVTGFKPTASLVIDSTKVDADKLAAFEDIIYGSESSEPKLPLPDEIATLFKPTASGPIALVSSSPVDEATSVALDRVFTLTFNNKIAADNITLDKGDNVAIGITKSWDTGAKILTITPNSHMTANTLYYLHVVGVKDIYNQTLADTVINFHTATA